MIFKQKKVVYNNQKNMYFDFKVIGSVSRFFLNLDFIKQMLNINKKNKKLTY